MPDTSAEPNKERSFSVDDGAPSADLIQAELLGIVAELRSEIDLLRSEVAGIKHTSLEVEAESLIVHQEIDEPEARASLVQVGEAEEMGPDPGPEIQEVVAAEPESTSSHDAAQLSEAEALAPAPLVAESELEEAILALNDNSIDDDFAQEGGSDLDSNEGGLSSEEMEALFAATNELSTGPVAETVSSDPEPATEAGSEAVQEQEILTVEQIQAMLGVKEPDDALEEVAPVPSPDVTEGLGQEAVDAEGSEDSISNTPEPIGNMPSTTGGSFGIDDVEEAAVSSVPAILAVAALALPVCIVDEKLHCLSVEPFDQSALDAIGASIGMAVVPHIADVEQVVQELRNRYGALDDRLLEPMAGTESLPGKPSLLSKMFRRSA